MPDRKKLIRLIHVAKRDLSMPDDSYRAILQQVGGKDSAADLSDDKLEQVLRHLKKCGFTVKAKGSQRPLADDGQSKAILAIWLQLAAMGIVRDASEVALGKYVCRMVKIEALQWLSTDKASKVIEHLKQWRGRIIKERDAALRRALGLPAEATPDRMSDVVLMRQTAERAIGRLCDVCGMTEVEFQQVLKHVSQQGAA